MGKYITTLFAESVIKRIDGVYNLTWIPDGFKNGAFDSIHTRYECSLEDCHLNDDGFWVTNNLTSGDGLGHLINHTRFFWRIEPNYCYHGKPFYDAEKQHKLFKASETKKVILETGKAAICLEWFEFLLPTDNIWGLRQGPVYITIYEYDERIWTSKKEVNKTGWKKEFIEFIETRYKYNPNQG